MKNLKDFIAESINESSAELNIETRLKNGKDIFINKEADDDDIKFIKSIGKKCGFDNATTLFVDKKFNVDDLEIMKVNGENVYPDWCQSLMNNKTKKQLFIIDICDHQGDAKFEKVIAQMLSKHEFCGEKIDNISLVIFYDKERAGKRFLSLV